MISLFILFSTCEIPFGCRRLQSSPVKWICTHTHTLAKRFWTDSLPPLLFYFTCEMWQTGWHILAWCSFCQSPTEFQPPPPALSPPPPLQHTQEMQMLKRAVSELSCAHLESDMTPVANWPNYLVLSVCRAVCVCVGGGTWCVCVCVSVWGRGVCVCVCVGRANTHKRASLSFVKQESLFQSVSVTLPMDVWIEGFLRFSKKIFSFTLYSLPTTICLLICLGIQTLYCTGLEAVFIRVWKHSRKESVVL